MNGMLPRASELYGAKAALQGGKLSVEDSNRQDLGRLATDAETLRNTELLEAKTLTQYTGILAGAQQETIEQAQRLGEAIGRVVLFLTRRQQNMGYATDIIGMGKYM